MVAGNGVDEIALQNFKKPFVITITDSQVVKRIAEKNAC
jgi:hypothetical protein